MKKPQNMKHDELLLAYADIMREMFKRKLAKPEECGWTRVETMDADDLDPDTELYFCEDSNQKIATTKVCDGENEFFNMLSVPKESGIEKAGGRDE